MTVSDRNAMLARGDALWEQLRGALDAHMDEPADEAGWTGKDVYAHFARWQQQTIGDLRRLMAGQPPAPVEGDEDVINARWHAEDRTVSAAVARQRCVSTRDELRAMLAGLNDREWERFGRACAPDISGQHYEAHLRGIEVKARAR